MMELNQNLKMIPINSQLNPEINFPIDLLPDWLQQTVNEHSQSYGTPRELWATAFLSGISAAAGKHYKLITGNYENYPQLWLMVVGASGTGKSEAFKVAFRRLGEIDKERYSDYQAKFKEWEQNEKQGNIPHWEQICINDSTPEALFSILKHSDNGLTLYRDELNGWFGDIGRYTKSGEIGHYLSIFDNSNFSINRKQERPQLIAEPLLNIFGTIQPSVLGDALQKNHAESSGFAQRFLFLYPEFPVREYKDTTIQPTTYEKYSNFISNITSLENNYTTTPTSEAQKEYGLFYNECELKRSKSNEFWAAVYSKAQIQVLRLALTVKIARLYNDSTDFVEVEDMQCAVEMMRYFIQSLKRFKAEIGETKKKTSDVIRAIYRINPNASQTETAKLLNISQQYVSKVVRLLGVNGLNCLQQKDTENNGYNQNKTIEKREVVGINSIEHSAENNCSDIQPTTAQPNAI